MSGAINGEGEQTGTSKGKLRVPQSDKAWETLYLVPFDNVSTKVLHCIGGAIKMQIPLYYTFMEAERMPMEAFNPARRQYLSTALLNLLSEKFMAPGRRILGVCESDLYVPELNFVFGEADMKRGVAVISLSRLHQEFYGLPPDEKIFMRRALTEAVHELGHTYGLPHCRDPHCVMFFSNSLADTDRKGYRFCKRCLNEFAKSFSLRRTD
ncbi:MAG: archaemetzincin family Zn-dependent metalloprotease [Candidatus Sumerlaeota bacterium]|nr:archaemetzincin family Zn-dependent metalloprotease [Candidatus Sumerlaeota bacterium]